MRTKICFRRCTEPTLRQEVIRIAIDAISFFVSFFDRDLIQVFCVPSRGRTILSVSGAGNPDLPWCQFVAISWPPICQQQVLLPVQILSKIALSVGGTRIRGPGPLRLSTSYGGTCRPLTEEHVDLLRRNQVVARWDGPTSFFSVNIFKSKIR